MTTEISRTELNAALTAGTDRITAARAENVYIDGDVYQYLLERQKDLRS